MSERPTYEELKRKIRKIEEENYKFQKILSRHNSLVKDPDTRIIETLGSSEDITEQKRMEETLAKKAERLELAARAAKLGIWDWDIQKNELLWNDRMYELYGVDKENFSGAYEAWLAGIHPDDREISDMLSEKARKGECDYDTEFRILWPNGTVRILKAYGQVIWDLSNNPLRMIGVNYDITVQRKTEADLQESERKFKSIFDDANDGILLADVATKQFVMANNVICKMLGYTKAEILNLSIYDIHAEKELPFAIKGFERQTIEEIRLVENLPVKRKDGTIFYADINSSPISIGTDTILVGVFRDITKRKKTEDMLKKNEQRYKKAQKMGKVGNWEYDILTESFWGSDEAKRIYGFDPESKNITIHEVENCIPDRERVHQALTDLIEKGLPYDLEFEIQPIGGPNKKIIQSIAEIVKNESGIPVKVDGAIHDITNLKLADEKLLKSEEKYRNLFNSINDYILIADINRNIIDSNQALKDGFGYTLEEIIGKKTIYLYDSEEEYQKMGKELKKHFEDTQFVYTINYRKKSGETFPGETNIFYLKNDKGEINGFIGIIRDITYRKMVEESLQRANDQLNEKAVVVEDMNAALRVLLQKREKDNQEIEENILSNYELMITPFFHKLKNSSLNNNQQNLLNIVEANLKEIVAPFSKKLSNPLMSLTPSEIQIAAMIKQGFSNKEIAQVLNNSVRTITKHRDHIREKLNLKNKKINLGSYLSNL